MVLINEKTGKQTLQFEKQLIKISQELSGAKPVKTDDKQGGTGQGLQQMMVEYQQLGEILKETYLHFKNMLLLSIDQQHELVKTFKDS